MTETRLKVMTYNIAGLPDKVNLNELSAPCRWLYKAVKFFWRGMPQEVSINTDGPCAEGTRLMGEKMLIGGCDLIGLNEDFNYHWDLTDVVCGEMRYDYTTWLGGLFPAEINKMLHWHWNRLPSWRTDGLNMLTKRSRIRIKTEDIVAWKDYSGYIDHDNDGLMDKGFRCYGVTVDGMYDIDVYVLHMDSSQGNTPDRYEQIKQDVKVRTKQMRQLSDYIIKKDSGRPAIIMGDFNSYYTLDWDHANLLNEFIGRIMEKAGHLVIADAWMKCGMVGFEALDKIFYINDSRAAYELVPESCTNDLSYAYKDGRAISDHHPVTAEFLIKVKDWSKQA